MSSWPPGAVAPRPGAAPLGQMILAQTRFELLLTLRRGESVLLTLVIPVLLLVTFATLPLVDLPGEAVDFLVPGVLALAVMSTAFTGQAIATGFERSYGALKRLGATALPRSALLLAKTAAVVAVEALQVTLLVLTGFLLGWSPQGSPLAVLLLLLLLGTATFSGLGLLMAGVLPAEVTLAAANLVYLLLLVGGSVIFPLTAFPEALRVVLELLPITALADGLRSVLVDGAGLPGRELLVLAIWAVGSLALAARTFRWE